MNDCLINEQNIKVNNEFKSIEKVLLLIIYIIPFFTQFSPMITIIISIIQVLLILYMFLSFDKSTYKILPVLLFFYSYMILPGGISVYRVFTILFLINYFMRNKLTLKKTHIVYLSIVILYSLLVISTDSLKLSLTTIFDMVFIITYVSNLKKTSNKTKSFFKYLTYTALLSFVFTIINKNIFGSNFIYIGQDWVEITRMSGTFEDPNYLGFFLNIIIFSNIILPLFKNKTIRILILAILYYYLFSTVSITGILCNFLGLFLYLILVLKLKIKYVLLYVTLILIVLMGYNYSLSHYIAHISDISIRIKSLLTSNKDLDLITSNRTVLWNYNWSYFTGQSPFKMLFGGNRITPISFDKSKFMELSHQEYLDLILNIGLMGFIIIMTIFITDVFNYYKTIDAHDKETVLTILFSKYVWFFYGFALTMFLDSRFSLFFLL
ncbi:MAG TPA: hypothetical protein GX747_01110 [Tenericutes bacterium]|nr:hypothetical protein [Mycoplasmatota bacterium]